MDLRQLKYFETVAELCHFGRAAERLHLAQPALSQSIRRLEQEVGVTLFDRTTRQVRLTPAGSYFRDEVRRILSDLDSCMEVARHLGQGTSGVLRMGFTGTSSFAQLPRISRILQEAMPEVHLDIHADMLTPQQVARLVDGSLDIGILRGPVHEPDIITHSLGGEQLLLALPHDHRLVPEDEVHLADLAPERLVTYSSQFSSVKEALDASCRRADFTPNIVQRAPGTTALLALVAAGQGIALVPESAQVMQPAGVVLKPVLGAERVDLSLAVRADNGSPLVTKALAALADADLGTPPAPTTAQEPSR